MKENFISAIYNDNYNSATEDPSPIGVYTEGFMFQSSSRLIEKIIAILVIYLIFINLKK
jgi:hypothetical protein